jgi:threonine dehydrogenase-like Zn-dependent dehydrogenase
MKKGESTMKAKAMVLVKPGRIEMQEFDVLEPKPDQILVKTGVTSVCASDPKIFRGETPFKFYPIIMGHELAGKVADIGAEALALYGLKVGDRITVEPTIPCGRCGWCRTQYNYHKCRPLRAYGVTMLADQLPYLVGGYAEYMYLLPGSLVYKVAEGVPDLAASLSSVIGNGVRWIKTLADMTFGQSLVISGVGSQGLATLIAAQECGVGPIAILGLGRDAARFELAREYGVDHTIDIEQVDPHEAVPDLLGGPPDVVVETSGVPSAIQMALDLVKMKGSIVSIGLSGGKETPIEFDALVVKGVTIFCDHAQAGNYPDAMRILNAGTYAIEKINNFTYTLKDLPSALEEAANPPEGFIKGAVVFD